MSNEGNLAPSSGGQKFLNALRFIAGLPIFLFVVLPIFVIGGLLMVYAYIVAVFDAGRLKKKMARAERSISERSLREKGRRGAPHGTLICESYTLGWPFARLWWTPDSLTVSEPPRASATEGDRIEQTSGPYEQWVFDTYVGEENGKALLVRAWIWKRTLNKLKVQLPEVPLFNLWSGAILMNRQIAAKKIGKDSSTISSD
jgi:hypothetical protein